MTAAKARGLRVAMRLAAALFSSFALVRCGSVSSKLNPSSVVPPSSSMSNAPGIAATASPSPLRFVGSRAMQDVDAQMAFGPRPTGSDASRKTADYIRTQLTHASWQVETQSFTYQDTQAQNIIARAGSGSDVFIFGAHYDTRRRADQDRASPTLPVPGANDGASGVAVLLELARVIDLSKVKGQVWLVFFDAEDNGHLDGWDWIAGSRYFVSQLKTKPAYAIVVDMVGDADQNIYLDGNSDPTLRDHLWDLAAKLGYGEYFIPQMRYSMLDDHTPFMQSGIPGVDIIDFDYPFWHTTQDTADKLSPDSLERVGRLLEAFLESGGEYPKS